MADTKMSALPVANPLAGADIFAIAQGGVSKQASATQIATFVGAGSAPPFDDGTAIVKGSADATKLLRFEVDGFTAGATRILTPPNANATIAGLQIAQTFSEVQTFSPGNNLIPVVIAAASVTGAGTSPFLDISGTWNTTGAPDAIRLTVTDTASNAAANLLDLMIGAASLFAVRKDGRATIAADALIAGAASPAITSIRVSVGAAAAQNVIRINGNSTADNAPVLDFLRSGNREWTFAPISNSFFISNSGGVANFNDATLNATPNWEFTSTGALKLNLGTVATGLLHVNTNTSGAGLTIFEQASADTDCYDLSFRKTRGTVAVPTVITAGDELGSIIFRGYSGAAGYVTGASIRAVSSGTIATTRVASSLIFATGTDAAPTVLTNRLIINNAGTVFTSQDVTALEFDVFRDTAGAIAGTLTKRNISLTPTGRITVSSGGSLAFSANDGNGTDGGTSGDTILFRDAAATLALRNTTIAAQTFRVYETTDAGLTNYSRTTITTQVGNHLFRTEAAGTGTLHILQVGTGPSTGTDIAGVDSIFHSGQSTGAGLRGAILFQQSTPTASSATVNALTTTWSINTNGDIAAGLSTGSITVGSGGAFIVSTRSRVSSAADGDIRLLNSGSTGFTKLQFGGITSSFPAIGRDAVNGFTFQTAAGAATWNDASTAASGTVADRYMFGIATPTLTSTNATVTYTRAASLFLGGAPVASTNVTIGTAFSLYVAGGLSRFDGSVLAQGGTAIPAGGTAGAGVMVSSTANFGVFFGSGAPSLSAAKGSLYLRSDGSGTGDRAYINTDGATAWTAITTAT